MKKNNQNTVISSEDITNTSDIYALEEANLYLENLLKETEDQLDCYKEQCKAEHDEKIKAEEGVNFYKNIYTTFVKLIDIIYRNL